MRRSGGVPASPGGCHTTLAATASWPSRNTVAVIGRCSPTTARAENDPHDTTGATSEMPRRRSARPVIDDHARRTLLPPATRRLVAGLCRRAGDRRRAGRPAAVVRLCRVRALRRFTVRATLPEPLQPLASLVTNLRWSWHPETRDLFEALDPELWRTCNGDPVKVLGEVSAERLGTLAKDRRFLRRLQDVVDDLQEYMTADLWYQS